MPKPKRSFIVEEGCEDFLESEKKAKLTSSEMTDVRKSLMENIDNRIHHWKKVEEQISVFVKEVESLRNLMKNTPDIPSNRPKLAQWRAKVNELENKINRLKRSNDQTEYLYCVANVLRESPTLTTVKKEETIRVNACGPLKPKIKKKKLPRNRIVQNKNTFNVKPITSHEMFSGMFEKNNGASIKLAQYLHEIPIETCDTDYCPTCITIEMQFNERPPALFCPKCGLSIGK